MQHHPAEAGTWGRAAGGEAGVLQGYGGDTEGCGRNGAGVCGEAVGCCLGSAGYCDGGVGAGSPDARCAPRERRPPSPCVARGGGEEQTKRKQPKLHQARMAWRASDYFD